MTIKLLLKDPNNFLFGEGPNLYAHLQRGSSPHLGTRKLDKSQKIDKLIAKGVSEEPGMHLQPFEVVIVENKYIVHLWNNNLVLLKGTEI